MKKTIDHPGVTLDKKLKETNMSRKELAQRTNVTEKHICTVINGDRGISAAFAQKLGYVFDTPAEWLQRQAEYEEYQLYLQEENSISKEEIDLLKPLHEIMEHFIEKGYMHNGCGAAEKVIQLRKLLKISDLLLIPNISYNAAYRAQLSSNVNVNPYVLFAWQALCEKETEQIHAQKILDKKLLRENVPAIKEMMFKDINDGIEKIQKLLSQCGIAFQVVKNFRGAPVQGFIKETADQRLILCLTIRRKRADSFWFTLFHELGHVLYGDYSSRFVDFDAVSSAVEARADAYAKNTLIEPSLYRDFLNACESFTFDKIKELADKAKVKPFIVIGRLQKDGHLDWSEYAKKIPQYSWA